MKYLILLLAGPAGCGKTTVAKALCNELGGRCLCHQWIRWGTLPWYGQKYCKKFRFDRQHFQVVWLDTKSSSSMRLITQQTTYNSYLRAFTEEFSGNCRFIFTCNFKNKIIEPLHSRCACIDFSTNLPKDKPQLAAKPSSNESKISWMQEGVEYDNKVLVELINKHFPDWRRVLNECQRYSASGKIDTGILATFQWCKSKWLG